MARDALYLSVRDVADRLGVTTRSVYAMLRDGRLRGAIRIGRGVRIPAEALDALPAYEPPAGHAGEVSRHGDSH